MKILRRLTLVFPIALSCLHRVNDGSGADHGYRPEV